jgi:hypothetical protein
MLNVFSLDVTSPHAHSPNYLTLPLISLSPRNTHCSVSKIPSHSTSENMRKSIEIPILLHIPERPWPRTNASRRPKMIGYIFEEVVVEF